MLPRPLTLRGRLIAALLVFSAVGLAMFAGASELLLRHSLLSRANQQLHHFPLHRLIDGHGRGRTRRGRGGLVTSGCEQRKKRQAAKGAKPQLHSRSHTVSRKPI